jgi:hypothetical protein
MKLLIMKFSPLPCYIVPLRPKYYTVSDRDENNRIKGGNEGTKKLWGRMKERAGKDSNFEENENTKITTLQPS